MSQTCALVLGAFLSAGTGVLLFIIARCFEKKDKRQDMLFAIYQQLKRTMDLYKEDRARFEDYERMGIPTLDSIQNIMISW